MKRNSILVVGLLILAFTVVGFFGNFVQWSGRETTTAKILNAERQWVRKGEGHINLDIEYQVADRTVRGTAEISPSDLPKSGDRAEIEVYYMKKKPERVIPVAVLDDKQRTIYITLAVGITLTVIGSILGCRKSLGDRVEQS